MKANLKVEREVKTFWDLFHASYVMLEITSEITEGQYYTIMSSILFSAFSFEAYLNHLGSKRIPFWDEIESIRVLDKYNVLAKQFSINPDYGRKPYQILKELFKFRNSLAHGKSKILTYSAVVDATVNVHDYEPHEHWEEFCTLENAKLVRVEIEKLITELNIAASEGEFPFQSGMTISHLSLE